MHKTKFLRLSIAQVNVCVGDLEGNTQKIISYIDQARAKNCDIISFPELAVCGYPPEDLLFKKSFIKGNGECLQEITKRTGQIAAVVGFVDTKEGALFNAAAVLADKKIVDIYHKVHLPNYGVFDEKRYFQSGKKFSLYNISGICFGLNICEDIWVKDGVIQTQAMMGAGLILTINASPYHMGKIDLRRKILKDEARKNNVFISYANLVGAQDELVFDGRSMFVSSGGRVLSTARAFEEEICILDIDPKKIPHKKQKPQETKVFDIVLKKQSSSAVIFGPKKTFELREEEEVFKALVIGTRDYLLKNGFQKAALGLSGGIDSSLVACLACEALGRDNLTGVILPSKFNSQDSYDDAVMLAMNLEIEYKVIHIQDIFEGYLAMLRPLFSGMPWNVAEENLQARIRGNILMALSNKLGWLILATGNKSEMGVGYATLYGDMAGGFAVIKDVPKTLVYRLAEFYNIKSGRDIIPRRVFEKAPSAELKENQKDSDSLPVYDILDPILKCYVEEDMAVTDIVRKGFDKEAILKTARMVDKSEYKRRQASPGVKITPRAFGRDRRMPITNKFIEIIR